MRYRSLSVVSEPKIEPVTLADAKQHMRVDTDDDNAYILALISAARRYAEEYLDRALITQQLRMRVDTFPYEFELPRPPMATAGTFTATQITYTVDPGGAGGTATLTTATLSTSTYRVDRDATPGRIRTVYGGTWPSHLSDPNSIGVTWYAGYGQSATDVPQAIRHAILMHVAHLYERRLAADSHASTEVPFGVRALLDTCKWGSYR
ncbi:MAG: head-tail connector protein [Gammaproteobacteria bacterium]